MKYTKQITSIAIVVGILLTTGVISLYFLTLDKGNQRPKPVQTPVVQQPKLRQDEPVAVVMQALGLDYSKLNLIYGLPDGEDQYTKSTFAAPNTISLKIDLPFNQAKVALSHEYIHYIQAQDPTEATAFYPYLRKLEVKDKWLGKRVESYRNGKACGTVTCTNVEAELEAIACTEMPDYALSADFVVFCNKYLPHRYDLL